MTDKYVDIGDGIKLLMAAAIGKGNKIAFSEQDSAKANDIRVRANSPEGNAFNGGNVPYSHQLAMTVGELLVGEDHVEDGTDAQVLADAKVILGEFIHHGVATNIDDGDKTRIQRVRALCRASTDYMNCFVEGVGDFITNWHTAPKATA